MGIYTSIYAGWGWEVEPPEDVDDLHDWLEELCEDTDGLLSFVVGGSYDWDSEDRPCVIFIGITYNVYEANQAVYPDTQGPSPMQRVDARNTLTRRGWTPPPDAPRLLAVASIG